MKDKSALYSAIDGMKSGLAEMSDYIFDNPELGNQEVKAYARVTAFLEKHGFTLDHGVLGVPTAFRATYGRGAPNIGLLCEYDALEGMGHACAHHLQAPAVLGAAAALAQQLGENEGTITVYGTPAEETTSAKLPMAREGVFDHLDIALMMHGADRTTVDGKSLALNLVDFIFEGKAAHAAIAPEKGVSALDAVLMMFNGMEYLREHVRSDVRFHGVITDGGEVANIVPKRAAAQFYIRADDRPHLNTVLERVYNVARGAALATGASLQIREVKAYDNKLNVESLNHLLMDEAKAAGATLLTPPRKVTGSTDFSCVTYRVPGACLRVAFVPFDSPSHSVEWVEQGKSEAAHAALIVAAKALAGAAHDVIRSPELLARIKCDFESARANQGRSAGGAAD